jgi:drug/metabolite transporter (DMT)-like permease
VVAVTAISFAAIFFKMAEPTHPLTAAGIRLAVAALVLLPFSVRARRRGRLPGPVLRSGVLAGLLYGVHFGSWVTSLTVTSVAASVTLVTTTPLLLAVVGWLTGRDRPDRRLWLALGLGAAGLAVVGAHDLGLLLSASGPALMGDALALLGAAAMAGYMLIVRRHGVRLDVIAFAGVATGVGAVTLLATAAVSGVSLLPASSEAAVYLILAALVPQLIGHNLITWALRYTRPTTVGIAILGEPVGATLLGWIWLGEGVSATVAVGCLLTLGALVMTVWRRAAVGGRESRDLPLPAHGP